MFVIGWKGIIDSLDDGRVGDGGMSDDGGLHLHSWGLNGMRRRWLTWGWSRGNGLRWRGTGGRGGGQDSRERQCSVLDRQVRGEELLCL